MVEGWIDDVAPDGNRIRIGMTTADQRRLRLLIDRSLLEQSAVFQVLNQLQGRGLKVLALQQRLQSMPVVLDNPHQLEIRP